MSVKKLRLSIISFIMIAFIIMSTLLSIPMRTYARSEDRDYPHSISLSLSRSGSTVTYSITVNVQEYIYNDGPTGGAFHPAGGDYEVTLTYNGTTIDVTSGYYDAARGTCTLVSKSGTFNCSGTVAATATIRYLNGGDSYGNDWTGYLVSASNSLNSDSSSSGGNTPTPAPDDRPGDAPVQFNERIWLNGTTLFYDFESSNDGGYDSCNSIYLSSSEKFFSGVDVHKPPFSTYKFSNQSKSTVDINSDSTHILWKDEEVDKNTFDGNMSFWGYRNLDVKEIYDLYKDRSYYFYLTVRRLFGFDSVYCEGMKACKVTYNWNYPTSQAAPSPEYLFQNYSITTIPSCNIARPGYVFKEWNTKPNGSGKTYLPGDRSSFAEDTTLYAVWKEPKVPYTINFTLNGEPATNDFAYITGYVNGGIRVTQSREFSVLEIPGYTVSAKIKSSDENVFLMVGDNKSPGYEYTIPTKTINTGTTDTVNCGTIHTVAYDANGGTYGKDAAGNDIPGPEDMTKYYGTSIVVSSNTPTRIGYNFTQWKSDTTGTSYNPGTGYAYSQRGGTDTLKAQWKPITYTIHFDRNTPPGAVTEVTGNMADISQTYDVDSKLPKNAFKLDGCDFQGWNTKPDGSGDSYKDEEVIKNLTAKDGEMVILYAQWKVTYKVVGSLNDVVSENFTDANGTTYGNITYGKMIRNNAVAAYKDGDCNGDGHLTTADAELITKYLNGEVTPTDKEKVAMDINGDGNITVSDRDKVLQLIEELTLTSSKKNVFTLMGTKLMCYDYPGYKIASSIKKTTDDVYIMGINDVTYSNTTTREVNIPEKIINSTFSDVIRFGTIHAIHFSPNDVTDGNGSTEATNVPDDITKYYGKDIKIPDAPKRDGYNFKGWTSDKTPNKIYQPGDTYNYAQRGGTDTLTAQWDNNI